MRNCLLLLLIKVSFCYAAEPTIQASNIKVKATSCSDVQLTWTNGNGAWRIILMRADSAVNQVPVDGTGYFPNNTYGLGSKIGGNYVVFNNVQNAANFKGLKENTRYHIAIFEHDGSKDYLVTNPARFSFTTKPMAVNGYFSAADSCQNTNKYTFISNVQTTVDSLIYIWDFGDGNSLQGDTVSYSYKTAGVFDIGLRVRNALGTCNQRFDFSKKVTVVPRTRPLFSISPDTVQCGIGSKFDFFSKTTMDNVSRSSFVVKYRIGNEWSNGLPNISKIFDRAGVHKVSLQGETFYRGKKTGCIDSVSTYVIVLESPTDGISLNDSLKCINNNLFILKNSLRNIKSQVWLFSPHDSTNTALVQRSYNDTGTYTVLYKGETVEGCKSEQEYQLKVFPNPTVFLGNDTSVREDIMFTLKAGSFQSYLWSNNSQSSTIVLSKRNLKSGPNQIWVRVVDSNGCENRDTIIVDLIPGLKREGLTNEYFEVWPNPASDKLFILPSQPFENSGFKILTPNGRCIKKGSINSSIRLDGLKSGIYFIQIECTGKLYYAQMVKV